MKSCAKWKSAAAAVACAVLPVGCTARDQERPIAAVTSLPALEAESTGWVPERPGLHPVALPDMAQVGESVREQIRARYRALTEGAWRSNSRAIELGDAYGEMGKLFMAANYPDAAEASLLNAHTLVTSEFRWVYYLGHLYRMTGKVSKSVEFFELAMQIRPEDVSTLVWLGETYLSQGRTEAAAPLFARALSLDPDSLSAKFGLGRTALAQQDYRRAVKYLEEVLVQDSQAAAVHYPLSLAYRAQGQSEKADAHLRLRRDHEILPADPLIVELEQLLQSPQAYETRGIRALSSGDWTSAAEHFRKGLELAPANPSLRHRLGTALFMAGDASGARDQFEQSLQASPQFARAHYSLGVLLAEERRHAEAIEHLSVALTTEPKYAEARLALATSLRRVGRPKESLPHYEQLFASRSQLSEALFGYAMALVQLRRYQDARDQLEKGLKAFPDEDVFPHALARLLAAAPDDSVRDGAQALTLARELIKKKRGIELGETLAMALAEVDRYDEAATVQRELMKSAAEARANRVVRRLEENLRLYERRKACRMPWTEGQLP